MQISITCGADNATIKAETAKLRNEIATRLAEIKVLQSAIQSYVSQCKHKGQKTGSNERDGSWGNPCPTCGYSY